MSKNVYRRVQEIANIKIYQASSYEFIESPKLFNFDQPALNTTLNLNSLYLKSLPPNFVSFNFVTRLSLQNNLLTTIPAELTSLKALEILDCSFNFLKDIPGWLSSLVNLKIIDLSFNHIRSVDLLVKCPKLEEADLMCNMIKSIPEGLLKLKNIDLSLNPISADLLIRLNDEATNFGKVFEFSYAIDFLDSESDQVLDSKLWDSLFDSLR